MIPYHGTPITPDKAAVEILMGRHAIVSFAHPGQLSLVADICQSFVVDNGAFSFWKTGKLVDTAGYYRWVEDWYRHPGFDWALIPDVIDGSEEVNDALLAEWPFPHIGVPVWHLHESLGRLCQLVLTYARVAIGSSGQFAQIGTVEWNARMAEAMDTICEDGQPIAKLHGLRMLNPKVFGRYPFASVDSTNVARNIGLDKRWKGTYVPATKAARGIVLAGRIEQHQSAAVWGGE